MKKQKQVPTSFKEKKAICKMQNFYILVAFLLINITLLITIGIYFYLINIEQNKNIYYHFATQIMN